MSKDKPIRMWALRRKSDGKWYGIPTLKGTDYFDNLNRAMLYRRKWYCPPDYAGDVVPVLVTVREERKR